MKTSCCCGMCLIMYLSDILHTDVLWIAVKILSLDSSGVIAINESSTCQGSCVHPKWL